MLSVLKKKKKKELVITEEKYKNHILQIKIYCYSKTYVNLIIESS